jgi:hypothetical protein
VAWFPFHLEFGSVANGMLHRSRTNGVVLAGWPERLLISVVLFGTDAGMLGARRRNHALLQTKAHDFGSGGSAAALHLSARIRTRSR